jgi:molybdenum cofactor cytidylyltransferase
VVFHRRQFDELAAVDGDRGGRALFGDVSVTRVAVDDPGVLRDVDTRADLDR